jgi:replication-associated recombination protein RarA
MGTALRDKVVERTVNLLCAMGEMPTKRPLEEPDIKVGLEAKVDRVVQLLTTGNDSMVLLHGMGGIGKTTLARAVFNHLHANHPTLPCCFLGLDPDTKVAAIPQKQQQLLKDLARVERGTPSNAEEGRGLLAETLQGKRVLLVVDNVWGDRLGFLLP